MICSLRSAPLGVLASLALFLIAATSVAAPIDHTFVLTLNHSSGARMAIPPSIAGLEVTSPAALSDGGPTYQGETTEHNNPLFEGIAGPGSSGSVMSVSFEFLGTKSAPLGGGVVHRDIAARNLRVVTNEGVYESAEGQVFTFTNDGPEDLRGVGPVRWMAPESIRTQEYVPSGGDLRTGYWELAALSYFDVSYPVPEPASAVCLAFGLGVTALRRRR